MKLRFITLALCLVYPVVAEAQSPVVAPGARVRITAPGSGMKRHVTTVTDVRGDSIVVDLRGAPRTLTFADVTALDVSTGRRSRFLLATGLGLGIGVGGGAVVGAATHDECVPKGEVLDCFLAPDNRAQSAGWGALALGVVGMGIGAVVGAFHRSDRWASVDLPVRAAIRPTRSGGVSITMSRGF